MSCPDHLTCPQPAPNGKCKMLMGNPSTHSGIRANCPGARIAKGDQGGLEVSVPHPPPKPVNVPSKPKTL